MNYEILSFKTTKKLKQQELEINRLYDKVEKLEDRIENAKYFIDQVLMYHLLDYEKLDKDCNELYGILMGKESDKE